MNEIIFSKILLESKKKKKTLLPLNIKDIYFQILKNLQKTII